MSWYLTLDKALSETPTKEFSLSYNSDPCNPVSTIGGRNLFLPSGPRDQRPIESREDVLVFTSKPLEEDIEVTGNLEAKLYFSTDAADTDVVVRLTDVYPDGKSILISDGICRTATPSKPNHNSSNASLNESKEIRELTIDLWSTSTIFAKGHCIRISICGSNYPRYEKNLNVGTLGSNTDKYRVAKHTIHMGDQTPSRLILPVVSNGSQ
jgi:putative CocE/NonD family hydrolase